MRKIALFVLIAFFVAQAYSLNVSAHSVIERPRPSKVTSTPTNTSVAPTKGATSTPTNTVVAPTPTDTSTPTPTSSVVLTDTPTPTSTSTPTYTPTAQVTDISAPYPNAPLCPDYGSVHDYTVFHTLWDNVRGCHYDHEHGTNPFTAEVAAQFPGFDLLAENCGMEIGGCNHTSPAENVAKHGGMKWDVMLSNPHGCMAGFESATYCITSAAIEYHNFGNYAIEMESRLHSAIALLKVCDPSNPSDCGYMFASQQGDYGQRVTPYQGTVLIYPNNPVPAYAAALGPYFTIDCVGTGLPGCRSSLAFIRDRNVNANSIWTSKRSGFVGYTPPPSSTVLRLLFRVRDNYQVLDSNDLEYPFTFLFICSSDMGITYNPAACRYNNSTTAVHEIAGIIPSSWDNLDGFDTNPAIGRITANGYVDKFGTLSPSCSAVSDTCFPIKMIDMFVGYYGDYLTLDKPSNTTPVTNPERDIYFCSGLVCSETSPNAIPSGWIGQNN